MARASPYLYTIPFGHDVDKTYGSPSVGHQTGWIEPFQNHRGVNSAAAWLDARRIRLLAFDTYSNIAVGRS
jgi:hypothetical protein